MTKLMRNSKSKRAGVSVELYFNAEIKRGIRLWNKQEEEAGREPLSERQFIQTAVAEKLRKDLDLATRQEHHDEGSTRTYALMEEE